jgi:hypothetical protein
MRTRNNSLGLVASGKRIIRPGYEFDNLYPKNVLVGTDPMIGGAWSDTFDTLNKMAEIVRDTLSDTTKVARKLKGSSTSETVRNIWDHVYKHFQYRKDDPNIEQIRRPARSWADRRSGIDCDCMSVLISSLLHNLKIDHAFRKAAYNEATGWQHVYVVVPKSSSSSLDTRDNYYVLDCVVDRFNYEVPYLKKYDKRMKIQYLNGVDFSALNGGVTPLAAYQSEKTMLEMIGGLGGEFTGLDGLEGVEATPQEIGNLFMLMLKQHLVNTRKMIGLNPGLTAGIYDPSIFLQRLDYLLSTFDNPEQRNKTLGELSSLEEREGNGGLGFFKKIAKGVKKVAQKVSSGVKTVAKKVATGVKTVAKQVATTAKVAVKKAGEAVKKVAQGAVKVVKAVAKAVVRYNPATVAIRNGLLLAMRLNLFRFAEKLGYGFWTEQQATEKGFDIAEFRKAQAHLNNVRNIHKKLGGKVDKLDTAIRKGWEHGVKKHNLIHGLGVIKRFSKHKGAAKDNAKAQRIKTIAQTRIKATIPLLNLVNEQLKSIQFKSILQHNDSNKVESFLQAIRTNRNGIATKLSLGYKPIEESSKYDTQEYAKLLERIKATENLVVQNGGTIEAFRDAVEAGKKVAINTQGMGAVLMASSAAASSVLAIIGKLLKNVNFSKLFKGRADSPHTDESEINNADVSAELDAEIDDEGDPNAEVVPFQNIVDSVSKNIETVEESPVTQAVVSAYSTAYKTPTYQTPGIVPGQGSQDSDSEYQDAQVVNSRLTPTSKDNTIKYVAIAGGIGVGLFLLYKAVQKPQPVYVPSPVPPAPAPVAVPVQQAMNGVKTKRNKSQRAFKKKVMAITI